LVKLALLIGLKESFKFMKRYIAFPWRQSHNRAVFMAFLALGGLAGNQHRTLIAAFIKLK
jgi:hypothetical protein